MYWYRLQIEWDYKTKTKKSPSQTTCYEDHKQDLLTNWLLLHNGASHTSFFTRDFKTKKQYDCPPHPPYFSVSPTEDKLKAWKVLRGSDKASDPYLGDTGFGPLLDTIYRD
jgi:hypothetical protein